MLRPEVQVGLIEGCATLLEQSFSLQPPMTSDVDESGDLYRSDRELFAEACGESVLNLMRRKHHIASFAEHRGVTVRI